MPATQFMKHVQRSVSLVPETSDAFEAMSPVRMARILEGHDSVMVLEAASTVLDDIENGRFERLMARLPVADQRSIRRWEARVRAEGSTVATTPVAPLAALAATTLALGQSQTGQRSDGVREAIADRLVQVGLRMNGDVVQGGDLTEANVAAFVARSALWLEVENADWMIWSGELIADLMAYPPAEAALSAFQAKAEISLEEWWCCGFGERATRALHGAGSWGGAKDIDERIERGWLAVSTTELDDAVKASGAALTRLDKRRPPTVANPFDLTWLNTRPVIVTDDDRRFQLWIGANTRALLPAVAAQVLSDVSGESYQEASSLVGRVAERRLTRAVADLQSVGTEEHTPESTMPKAGSKCDYLLATDDELLGLEFTILAPTRDLSAGTTDSIDALVKRVGLKAKQIYATFRRVDPEHAKRWLPLVVFVTPTATGPILTERVHELLRADEVIDDEVSDLMTCHAPAFLDLVEFVRGGSGCLVDAVLTWRDGDQRGHFLEWWLADRQANRTAKTRARSLSARAEVVLRGQPESAPGVPVEGT